MTEIIDLRTTITWAGYAVPQIVNAIQSYLLMNTWRRRFGWFIFTLILMSSAQAHDSWINKGGFRNAVGELCCGPHDCTQYPNPSSEQLGWVVNGEFIPYDEAMASPDGMLWICRRADGVRRCVFGIKPGT